jgi:hypothetical protein
MSVSSRFKALLKLKISMQSYLYAIPKIVLLTALSLIFHNSFSQLSYGIQSGFQMTTVKSSHAETDWKPSYHVGIFGNYTLTRRYSITANLLFSDKGYTYDTYADYNNYYGSFSSIPKSTYHFQYLDFPSFLQYKISNVVSVLAGGQVSYLLSSRLTVHPISESTNKIDYYGNRLDFGIGGGLVFYLNRFTTIQLRYMQGLSNIIKAEASQKIDSYPFLGTVNARVLGYKDHNEVLQLSMSFLMNRKSSRKDNVPRNDSTQNNRRASLGLKSGINIDNTSYRDLNPYDKDNSTTMPGINFGFYVKVKAADRLYFIPEFQFIIKGYTYEDMNNPGSINTEFKQLRMLYAEIPLMISYPLNKIVSMEAGPVFGYNLKSFGDRSKLYPSKGEFGVNGGFRIYISDRFSITTCYYRGLTNISTLYKKNYYTETTEYNTNFQLSTYFKLTRN